MIYTKNIMAFRRLMIFLICVVYIAGCAGGKATKRKAAFFEKWKTMAEKSRGHSPSPRVRDFKIPEGKPGSRTPSYSKEGVDVAHLADVAHLKLLPTDNVKLNLRKADVKAVLLSLARATDLNMLIKADITGDISVDFNDIPWDQAFNSIMHSKALIYEWEGDVLQIMSMEDMELDLKLSSLKEKRNAMKMGEKWVEPLLDVMISIDYADPRTLVENLKEFLTRNQEGTSRGAVMFDEHSNSLIIQAIRDDLTRMLELIKKIDKPIHQIKIDADIVEATKDTALGLGIQWGGAFRKGEALISPGGTLQSQRQGVGGTGTTGGTSSVGGTGTTGGQLSPPVKVGGTTGTIMPFLPGQTGLSGRGFGSNFPITELFDTASASGTLGFLIGSLDGNILDLQLQALQAEGKLNILSSPSITTMDNQMAFTENGETIPYTTTSFSETGGARESDVEFVDAVLRLEITPHVIGGDKLKMKIMVKKDEVDFSREVQGNPLIIRKQTETTLIVQDGETIVISGLTKNRTVDVEEGIPVLREIPVLGRLFRGYSNRDTMEEVLVFITPHILPTMMVAKAQERPDKDLIREVPDKSVIQDKPGKPKVQDKLKEALIQEGLDESVIQDKPEKPEVQEKPETTLIQEELEESVVEDEIDEPVSQEEPDKSVVR